MHVTIALPLVAIILFQVRATVRNDTESEEQAFRCLNLLNHSVNVNHCIALSLSHWNLTHNKTKPTKNLCYALYDKRACFNTAACELCSQEMADAVNKMLAKNGIEILKHDHTFECTNVTDYMKRNQCNQSAHSRATSKIHEYDDNNYLLKFAIVIIICALLIMAICSVAWMMLRVWLVPDEEGNLRRASSPKKSYGPRDFMDESKLPKGKAKGGSAIPSLNWQVQAANKAAKESSFKSKRLSLKASVKKVAAGKSLLKMSLSAQSKAKASPSNAKSRAKMVLQSRGKSTASTLKAKSRAKPMLSPSRGKSMTKSAASRAKKSSCLNKQSTIKHK